MRHDHLYWLRNKTNSFLSAKHIWLLLCKQSYAIINSPYTEIHVHSDPREGKQIEGDIIPKLTLVNRHLFGG